MSAKLRSAAFLAIVLASCTVAQAQGVTIISESAAYNALATSPSGSLLISNSTNTANQGQCASTSMINSFQYLQQMYPGTYGSMALTGGAGTANAVNSRNQLDTAITSGGSGGDQGDTWNAKVNWFNTHGGTANSIIMGVTANSSTDADYNPALSGGMMFNQSGTQIWNFLVQQIQQGEDVEIGMYDHMVTLIGVKTTGGTANTPSAAEIIDPNYTSPGGTGVQGMANGAAGEWISAAYSTYFGLVQLSGFSIGGTGYNSPYIYYAFAESPKNVPEPATIALLFGGGVGLAAAYKWRRRTAQPARRT
jgi:hypothetical protein